MPTSLAPTTTIERTSRERSRLPVALRTARWLTRMVTGVAMNQASSTRSS